MAEVVVASGILAVVASGLFGTVIMARHMIGTAQLHNEAQMIVMDKIWEVFQQDYNDLLNYDNPDTEAVSSDSLLHPYGGTLRSWALNYGDYIYIFVRVDWNQPMLRNGSTAVHESAAMYRFRSQR